MGLENELLLNLWTLQNRKKHWQEQCGWNLCIRCVSCTGEHAFPVISVACFTNATSLSCQGYPMYPVPQTSTWYSYCQSDPFLFVLSVWLPMPCQCWVVFQSLSLAWHRLKHPRFDSDWKSSVFSESVFLFTPLIKMQLICFAYMAIWRMDICMFLFWRQLPLISTVIQQQQKKWRSLSQSKKNGPITKSTFSACYLHSIANRKCSEILSRASQNHAIFKSLLFCFVLGLFRAIRVYSGHVFKIFCAAIRVRKILF